MELSIITINFRKPLLTIACIESVYKTYRNLFEKGVYELLIVDNLSGDESVSLLKKEIEKKQYKNVHLLPHTENNGFGGGNNYGEQHAKGKYVLFLNSDTVVGKGLDAMLSFLQDKPKIGVLGGMLKNFDGSEQSSLGKFYFLPHVFLLLLGMQRFEFIDKNPSQAQKVDWVKGACFMMQKDFFEKLHGFDEKIFMYTEDMELCYRVEKAEREVWFYPDVEILHKDQGSSSRSFAIISIYAGIMYFYKKHRNVLEQTVVKLLLQSKAILLVLYGKLTKSEYLVTTYEKALSVLG